MAPTLGKRKRVTRQELEQPSRASTPSEDSQESDGEDVQALFRKAFEAKFKPLEIEPVNPREEAPEMVEDDSEEEEGSDWSGISSADETDKVQVFDYATLQSTEEEISKAEKRAFMSSKPPTLSRSTSTQKPPSLPKKADATDDPTEASHLKNDLELQSLLRSSTLLSTAAPTYSTRAPTARSTAHTRHKVTDLHIQSLGAKTSIFSQKSMPMTHRKGIAAKAKGRDEKRRSEAKENGIVLEREKKERKVVGKRERGVGAPSVGRFKGGTLTLSRGDVASITRGGGGGGRGGKKGKRGRR